MKGVRTHTDAVYFCKAVILTTGTYLRGRIIIGDISLSGGPDGLFPAGKLSGSLKEKGIELMRFKTGTPGKGEQAHHRLYQDALNSPETIRLSHFLLIMKV